MQHLRKLLSLSVDDLMWCGYRVGILTTDYASARANLSETAEGCSGGVTGEEGEYVIVGGLYYY